jgi:hypothetical protein
MITESDQRLRSWIASLAGPITISNTPPGREETGSGVSLYLMEMSRAPLARKEHDQLVQITARYLVTTWAEQAQDAHELLERLMLGAMDNPEVQVEFNPLLLSDWIAFGVVPRPSFMLLLTLQRQRRERTSTLVSAPPMVRGTGVRRLEGVVLGPEDRPLANAQVEIPGLGLTGRTDLEGRFRFPVLPADALVEHLVVEKMGQSVSVALSPTGEEAFSPLVIHWKRRQ